MVFDGLAAHLAVLVGEAIAASSPRCLGVAAIDESGRSTREISKLADSAAHVLVPTLSVRIHEA
jgi:hypothetical protein